MTTINKSPRPLMFWASGGSIVMRMATGCFAIDEAQQDDLLSLFDEERRVAIRVPNGAGSDSWIAAMEKHNELSMARVEAGKWARASGCVSDIQRPDLLAALQSLMPNTLIGESYDPPVPADEVLKEFLFTWGKLRAARAAVAKALGQGESGS